VPDITVGLLSPFPETSELLRAQVHATGLAAVKVEVDEYCIATGDRSARRFLESAPNIIIVDMHERANSLQSLTILHSALPETWLFVTSDDDDAEVIIESMRVGAREFLPKPITNKALQQAIRRYMAERERQKETKSTGKIYWVTAGKCGSGATSVAINTSIAVGLAADTKVALLDLSNTFGDVGAFLNLKPKFTIDDAFTASSRLDSVLLDSYSTAFHGISVLAGTSTFDPGRIVPVTELARVLETAEDNYSHCFFDLPVSSDKDSIRLVTEMSTAILLVMTPDLPSIWRTDRLIRFFEKSDCLAKVRLIVNRSRKADEIRDTEIHEAVNHPVFWKLPNDYASCVEAVNSGRPVVVVDNSDLSRSYRELAHELTGFVLPEKRRGILKLFS
jgi:pilus assembly protein CpaE